MCCDVLCCDVGVFLVFEYCEHDLSALLNQVRQMREERREESATSGLQVY